MHSVKTQENRIHTGLSVEVDREYGLDFVSTEGKEPVHRHLRAAIQEKDKQRELLQVRHSTIKGTREEEKRGHKRDLRIHK